jgi:glutaconate CoA-transferase subunit B
MYLDTYHPGITVQQVKDNTGWDLKISPDVHETELPTEEQIRLLREELDPRGIFLKGGVG